LTHLYALTGWHAAGEPTTLRPGTRIRVLLSPSHVRPNEGNRYEHRPRIRERFDVGRSRYRGLLDYMQKGVGSAARVDAYLMQACGMPSPKADQAAVNRLLKCIKERKP